MKNMKQRYNKSAKIKCEQVTNNINVEKRMEYDEVVQASRNFITKFELSQNRIPVHDKKVNDFTFNDF
jgi:hypothetical protein